MVEELKLLLGNDPFIPFDVVMTSGERYAVRNPALTALGATVLQLYRPRSDRRDVLLLFDISSIEVLESA